MYGALRTAQHSARAFLLLAFFSVTARADAAMPPSRDRVNLLVSGTWTSLRLADETDSPVRWRGDGPGWRLTVEVPVRTARLRAAMRQDCLPVRVDAQGGHGIDPGQYPVYSRFRQRRFLSREVSFDARWRAASCRGWKCEAGGFVRWRDEFLADTGENDGGGVSGVFCGPLLRSVWQTGSRWDLAAGVAFPLCGWYVRAPYLSYSHDYDWHRDIRFAALPECGQVDLEVVARCRLSGRAAVEGGGHLNYSWTDRNRRWREFVAQARLALVIGM
jgi:hypothetical protein